MKIGTTLYIDSAHRLPNHPGKCQHLHGHTYKVIVTVYGEPNPKTGMLIDFGYIKEIVTLLDHKNISEVPPFEGEGQATAEHIACHLSSNILAKGLIDNDSRLHKVVVRVYEGHNNWAESESTTVRTSPSKSKYLVPVWLCTKYNDGKMTFTDDWEIWVDGASVQRMTDRDIRPFYGGREPLRVRCFRTKEEMEEWRGQA